LWLAFWSLVDPEPESLCSPTVRNRNQAIRALAEWGMPRWPGEAHGCITDAIKRKPDEEVKARLESLLKG
jgi:hypothetical protein